MAVLRRLVGIALFVGLVVSTVMLRDANSQLIEINYMFGVGFSINDRVTLSTSFQGFYITNTAINSVDVRGSNLEPLSVRCSATIVRNSRIIEPFVQFGLTDAAPRANVGIVVTFY